VIVKAVKRLEFFYFLREKDFFYVPDVPNVPLHPFGGSGNKLRQFMPVDFRHTAHL